MLIFFCIILGDKEGTGSLIMAQQLAPGHGQVFLRECSLPAPDTCNRSFPHGTPITQVYYR
jgi:hypothetical protein